MDTKELDQIMRRVDTKKRGLDEMERFFNHLLDPANAAGSVKIESWSVSKQGETYTKNERFLIGAASPEFRQQVRGLLECFRAKTERELQDEVAAMTAFGQSTLAAKS
jgi:hypothetical protein